jgi:hypothetical protein
MYMNEGNEGTKGGVSFRTYEGARAQSSDRIHVKIGDQRQGGDEGERRSTHPRPHPAREMRVLRRRRGG